jgi:hypothetical protein
MSERLQAILQMSHARRIARGDKPVGYTYVIECQGYVKIGLAANPRLRLASLQTCNPFPLRLLAVFPAWSDMDADEARLHKEFARYRTRGEWHKMPDDVLFELVSRQPMPSRLPPDAS